MFIHDINPVLAEVFGIQLYYYGLAYAVGFLGLFFWLRFRRKELHMNLNDVYNLTILVSLGILIFGRIFEIVFYELNYYVNNPAELFKYWHGGMASHGVLIGAAIGVFLFCKIKNKRFLKMADELVLPGALFLALGRLGNFINGQIIGSKTNLWWGVKFLGVEGFRHPVALYESFKNFLLIPILFFVKRFFYFREGVLIAHFIFWYGFLRIFTDVYREYPTTFLGIGTGQYFNIFMAFFGLAIFIYLHVKKDKDLKKEKSKKYKSENKNILLAKKIIFILILLFCLIIPSSWTQGVLEILR